MAQKITPQMDIKKEIINKCLNDENYKQKFLKDPKGCLERELNVKLPENIQIKAVEETTTTKWVVIPSAEEMSEEELQRISGGGGGDLGTAIMNILKALTGHKE